VASPEPGPSAGPAANSLPLPERRWLRLDDFLVGPSNRLAYLAVQGLLQQPDQAPNPLTLYGPVGIGKTHLLEGAYMGLRRSLASRAQPLPRGGDGGVIFVTAEEFTNRFLQAMHEGAMNGFRRHFRAALALCVDDVHFLANKKATQEEFLHTFETLSQRGRPVVLTCDGHPRLIPNLLPELVDRLLGGGVWALEPPELPTRQAILKARAARIGCPLPADVIRFLAEHLCHNVRELEGAVHAIQHYSLVQVQPITLDLAREATADLLRSTARLVQLKDVERALCQVLGLEVRALHSKGRARAISYPRMLAMYLARKHTGAAYSEIGRHFGDRNHSTAIAAEQRIEEWLEAEKTLAIGSQRWRIRDLVERIEREMRR
jgi:chromosomal replication initiator protein